MNENSPETPSSSSNSTTPVVEKDPTGAQGETRRSFLRKGLWAGSAVAVSCGVYPFVEAGWLRITKYSVRVPRLPAPFSGLRLAFLSDVHHGPFTGLGYVRKVVRLTNRLKPDLIALGGDYVHKDAKYIQPCFEDLTNLEAPLGVFAVLGNHDHWEDPVLTKKCISGSGFVDLTNTGKWIDREGTRLRIAGVGDYMEDVQDLESGLADTKDSETCVLLSHNPDYVERVRDPRVGLVLSGHTHGGQVYVPGFGAPLIPSAYGDKYRYGLVQTDFTQVVVSCGTGAIAPPVRLCCRPEIVLVTLQSRDTPEGISDNSIASIPK